MPEAEEAQTPSLDDDGFESLDGNGSCDSNKEEQDISFTAEEYETAVKNSPVHNDSTENGLVIVKSCPKFKQNDINLSLCCCKNDANGCNAVAANCLEKAKADKQMVDECVKTISDDKVGPRNHKCSFDINCVPVCAVVNKSDNKGECVMVEIYMDAIRNAFDK